MTKTVRESLCRQRDVAGGTLHSPRKGPAFTVGDIRVEGLQRVTEGTVYNYLPINIGDTLSAQRVREAVRALYETGFFRDVETAPRWQHADRRGQRAPDHRELRAQGQQGHQDRGSAPSRCATSASRRARPSIARCSRTSSRSCRTSTARAASTRRASTPTSRKCRATGSRSRSTSSKASAPRSARSTSSATRPSRKRTSSRRFELKTPNLLSFYKQDDRYSRESLQGDLEKLRSFYMDRGYANFEVESTQVAIAPGEGRHLHHGERQRRRGLQGQGSEARRHLRDPGAAAAALSAGAARRPVLAQGHHRDAGAAAEPSRRRRLRLRQGRSGAHHLRRSRRTRNCR